MCHHATQRHKHRGKGDDEAQKGYSQGMEFSVSRRTCRAPARDAGKASSYPINKQTNQTAKEGQNNANHKQHRFASNRHPG